MVIYYSLSLPSRRRLLLKEFNDNGLVTIKIYFEDKVIAIHKLSTERGRWIMDDSHLTKQVVKKLVKRKKFKKNQKTLKNLSIIFTRSLEYYDQVISYPHKI